MNDDNKQYDLRGMLKNGQGTCFHMLSSPYCRANQEWQWRNILFTNVK